MFDEHEAEPVTFILIFLLLYNKTRDFHSLNHWL